MSLGTITCATSDCKRVPTMSWRGVAQRSEFAPVTRVELLAEEFYPAWSFRPTISGQRRHGHVAPEHARRSPANSGSVWCEAVQPEAVHHARRAIGARYSPNDRGPAVAEPRSHYARCRGRGALCARPPLAVDALELGVEDRSAVETRLRDLTAVPERRVGAKVGVGLVAEADARVLRVVPPTRTAIAQSPVADAGARPGRADLVRS